MIASLSQNDAYTLFHPLFRFVALSAEPRDGGEDLPRSSYLSLLQQTKARSVLDAYNARAQSSRRAGGAAADAAAYADSTEADADGSVFGSSAWAALLLALRRPVVVVDVREFNSGLPAALYARDVEVRATEATHTHAPGHFFPNLLLLTVSAANPPFFPLRLFLRRCP
jgi:hypothetical protein